MTRRRKGSTVPVCHFCHIDLPARPFYSAISAAFGLPVGVGWRICTPGCPDRPTGAVVVAR